MIYIRNPYIMCDFGRIFKIREFLYLIKLYNAKSFEIKFINWPILNFGRLIKVYD